MLTVEHLSIIDQGSPMMTRKALLVPQSPLVGDNMGVSGFACEKLIRDKFIINIKITGLWNWS